ncbi:VWA domain-containing protein [soil metagenome]
MTGISLSFARIDALWILISIPIICLLGYQLGRRHRVRRPVIWLRVAAIFLLVVTLAEPLISTADYAHSTIFVIDRSSSIEDATASSITSWVNDALATSGSSDRAAMVAFGSSPHLAQPFVDGRALQLENELSEPIVRDTTNIEAALAMARALPATGDRRIVLISDGAENDGTAMSQASQLAADGVSVDVLSVDGISLDDFRIEGLIAPSSIWMGEPVSLVMSIVSEVETPGAIEILVNGETIASQEATFARGMSSHAFTVEDLEPGFHALTARAVPELGNDRFTSNNEQGLAIVVRDAPHLLLVSAERADSAFLRNALERNGALVTSTSPSGIPERLSDLSAFDVVLLNNVPASELTVGQAAALDTMTREFGRGLIVIGGSTSYGPGGYANTDLEEMLPVSVKVTEGKERQRVALMLIVDKSGSMAYDPLQSSSKIDMAREAVRLASAALSDGDEVGILVFNDKQHWIVRLTVIGGPEDRERINAAIESITADGGTEIYPALSVGFDEISKSNADVRHVVLLSDGKSSTGTRESYDKLIEEIRDSNTTLSTIAIGSDADTDLLQFLAERGNGNYHPTERAEDIPILTLAEAEGAGSQSVIRNTFTPLQVLASPIMATFPPESLPDLNGYDFAEEKANAQVVLTSSRGDPILAKWQLGLGRVVAWTADDGIDFAADWRSWNRYDEFWGSVVQWTLPDPENGQITVSTQRDGSDTLVTISTKKVLGDYVDLSDASAMISSPSGGMTQGIKLYQSAPGEYQVRVTNGEPGGYQIDLSYGSEMAPQTVTTGFSVPASPELQPSAGAAELLTSIAKRTSGRVLSLDNPGAVLDAPSMSSSNVRQFTQIWWIPLLVALGLFLTEIAVRYQFSSQLRRLRTIA